MRQAWIGSGFLLEGLWISLVTRSEAHTIRWTDQRGPLQGVMGGLLAYGLLSSDVEGIASWRLLFLVEGVPAIVLGILVWWTLPGKPEDTVRQLPPHHQRLYSIATLFAPTKVRQTCVFSSPTSPLGNSR